MPWLGTHREKFGSDTVTIRCTRRVEYDSEGDTYEVFNTELSIPFQPPLKRRLLIQSGFQGYASIVFKGERAGLGIEKLDQDFKFRAATQLQELVSHPVQDVLRRRPSEFDLTVTDKSLSFNKNDSIEKSELVLEEAQFLVTLKNVLQDSYKSLSASWIENTLRESWGSTANSFRFDLLERELKLTGASKHYQLHCEAWPTGEKTGLTQLRLKFRESLKLGLEFKRQGFLGFFAKLFGTQDIKIGSKSLDKRFIIKSRDKARLQKRFTAPVVESLETLLQTFQATNVSHNKDLGSDFDLDDIVFQLGLDTRIHGKSFHFDDKELTLNFAILLYGPDFEKLFQAAHDFVTALFQVQETGPYR